MNKTDPKQKKAFRKSPYIFVKDLHELEEHECGDEASRR
jgi:hypothetical protein